MDNDCCFCSTQFAEIKMPVKCSDSPKGGCFMTFCKDCIDKYLRECRQLCPGCRSPNIVDHHLLNINLREIGPPPTPLYEEISPCVSDDDSDDDFEETHLQMESLLFTRNEITFEMLFNLLSQNRADVIHMFEAYRPLLFVLKQRAPFILSNLQTAVSLCGDPVLSLLVNFE